MDQALRGIYSLSGFESGSNPCSPVSRLSVKGVISDEAEEDTQSLIYSFHMRNFDHEITITTITHRLTQTGTILRAYAHMRTNARTD